MSKLEEIIEKYYEDKKSVDIVLKNEDAVSKQLGLKDLQNLKKYTIEKLNALKKDLFNRWSIVDKNLESILVSINEATDGNELTILGSRFKEYEKEANYLDSEINKINNYLDNDLEIIEEVKVVDEDLTLEDKSSELQKNSDVLDSLTKKYDDIVPFNDSSLVRKEAVDKDSILINSVLDIIKDTDSINVNDSRSDKESRYISDYNYFEPTKVSLNRVELPNGGYVNKIDIEEAIKKYVETNKGRKLEVTSVKEYTVNPEELEKCLEIIEESASIFVDVDNNAVAMNTESIEPLGPVSSEIKHGVYVPIKEVAYGMDQIINEETDEELEKRKIKELSMKIDEMGK